MTDQELQAIRERCYTAMAGPWLAHTSGSRGYGIQQSTMPYRDVLTQYPETGIAMDAPDAEFMAAARSDIPALLDALDEAQERIAELERQRDHARALCTVWKWRADGRPLPEPPAVPPLQDHTIDAEDGWCP